MKDTYLVAMMDKMKVAMKVGRLVRQKALMKEMLVELQLDN